MFDEFPASPLPGGEVPRGLGAVDRSALDGILAPFVMFRAVRDGSGIIVDFVYTDANQVACDYNQVSYEDLMGATLLDLLPGTVRSTLFARYVAVVETGEPLILDDFVYPNELLSGAPRRYDIRAVKVGDGLSYSWSDVTDRHDAVLALADSEMRYRLLAENSKDVVVQTDDDGRIEWVSESITQVLGWQRAQVLGTVSLHLVHPDDQGAAAAAHEAVAPGAVVRSEFRVRCADGSSKWMQVSAHAVQTDHGTQRIAGLRDITAEVAARDSLTYLAFHDELTGMRNRAWIKDTLASALLAADRDGTSVGVLFIDIDNFKVVNDSLGHVAGDQVLRDVAARVSAAMRPGDHLGRFGGDEFIVVATAITDPVDVEVLAERISGTVRTPLEVDGHVIVPSVSIGIALSEPGSTASGLLRSTDTALHRAKSAGRSRWQFYDRAMHAEALSRLTTEGEVRRGLAQNEFTVHYQPIVDLGTRAVTGHEALARWQHPTRGLLLPREFLPVAEDCGLIDELGDQVLAEVCRLLAARPDIPGQVSVNVSPTSLTQPGWAARIEGALATHDVDPSRLGIEIAETAALAILDSPHDDLRRLRDLGIGIHVDDFGTGYSSFILLRDLPVTGVKLDLTFTQGIQADETARVLAQGLAVLAGGLHLTAIAEGIETPQQAELIHAQGWTHGQGYLFGYPAPDPVASASPPVLNRHEPPS